MSGVSREYVKETENDWRLDKWFKVHFPGLNYGRMSKIIRKGEVRVDGKRVKANFRLEAGMEIRLPPLGKEERSVSNAPKKVKHISDEDIALMRSMVIYQDDSVIVLNKLPESLKYGKKLVILKKIIKELKSIIDEIEGYKRGNEFKKDKFLNRTNQVDSFISTTELDV